MNRILFVCLLLLPQVALADGPKDNSASEVRPIPPSGIDVPQEKLDSLTRRCKAIRKSWNELLRGTWDELVRESAEAKDKQNKQSPEQLAKLAKLRSLEPEVLVFPRAVEMAIEFGQFHKPAEIDNAGKLLDLAQKRINTVGRGGDWAEVVGLGNGGSQQLIVGGFKSKIDDSYQPYGVVIPAGWTEKDIRPRRMDLWLHGRGETLSEANFLNKQQNAAGEYTPADTFVVHPYGRYSNAFKFAGEIDVLEVSDYLQSRLPIDPERIAIRGFSMGGAGCWQMAVHYSDRFFAANPGAGFSETPEFLSFFQGENAAETAPTYQKTLWQLYDCPPWAANLNQCPTVVYSGEIDRQKQAADVMEVALNKIGIKMTHIIGPDTAHKIHPDSKREIESRMAAIERTTTAAVPESIQFQTMTLRYHKMHWVDVQGLAEHWKPAIVDASLSDDEIKVETENVTRLHLQFNAGQWPGNTSGPIHVAIDRDEIVGDDVGSDRSWSIRLVKTADGWQIADADDDDLRKRPELQGPIDDAFMNSFVFVLPSGKSSDAAVQSWIESESQHAMTHWRKHFRGDIRKIFDSELTEEITASSNLILFGTSESNKVIAELQSKLPVKWNNDQLAIGTHSVPSTGHVPILIYPNPQNADRYIVLNSGFTFREYDYLNNARQTPKLPDWALVDIREGATTQSPGKVIEADFFDESWQPK
ncbi:MAG: prolyl oligopeptidase family serine peptidase [Pirellulaceae bacterium]